jgi:heme exporter protein A
LIKVRRLHVEGLLCQRGGLPVSRQHSFSVASGEVLLLTGTNGSGKTTLLRTIAGYIAPLAGATRIEASEQDLSIQQAAHYLGHRDGLRAALSAKENLVFSQSLLGPGADVAVALETVGLARLGDASVGRLSAGQRRRVALARLLVTARPVWLLDEPTSSLDTASQELVARMIDAHCAAGGMVLAATHLDLGIAASRMSLDGEPPAVAP